jgi:hypothetical protein
MIALHRHPALLELFSCGCRLSAFSALVGLSEGMLFMISTGHKTSDVSEFIMHEHGCQSIFGIFSRS